MSDELETVTQTITDPASGEVIALSADTPHLLEAAARMADLAADLGRVRGYIVNEVASRLDRLNTRSDRIGPFDVETNAPTVETYELGALREELGKLVDEGILDASIIDRVIVPQERPPTPPPKLAKVEVNKLKRHPDRRVLAALQAARTVQPQKRTLKITRNAIEGTATDA